MIKAPKTQLRRLNMMNAHGFVRTIGPVFENSPWIAEKAFALHPFQDIADLHEKLCRTLREASDEQKLALIQAHPDLVGKMAQAGQLTPESKSEQAAAGLDRLSREEIDTFQAYNDVYREQFGFPFVICARENKKDAILAAFPLRLKHTREREIAVALEEICKIAKLRLLDLLTEE
jgi:OHCU decarboxylase